MFPEEGGPGLVHCRLVERVLDPEAIPAPERLGTVRHPVGVGAPKRGEARVEARVDDGRRVDAHVARAVRGRQVTPTRAFTVAPREDLVEPAHDGRGRGRVRAFPSPGGKPRPGLVADVEVADLVARVHARVGAPGDRRRDLLARSHGEGRLDLALDCTQAGLGGPPAKVGAVVAEV